MAAKIIREFSSRDGVGTFLLPAKELDAMTGERRYTYCGLEELCEANQDAVGFNPQKFAAFDGNVTEYTDYFPANKALWNPEDDEFHEYQPLAKNLVILRNTLYLNFFPDGTYDSYTDANKNAKFQLEQMGEVIGKALKREFMFRKTLTLPSGAPLAERRFGDYGVEHIGAAALYKTLLKAQNRFTFNPLRWIQGKFNTYDWNLPPIEETPLRARDIQEALFQDERKASIGLTSGVIDKQNRQEPLGMSDATARLLAEALQTQSIARELLDPGALRAGDAERSVELAHHIIENLKRMKFDNANEGLPGIEQQAHDLERGELIAELAMAYQNIMADLAEHNPDALSDPSFEMARLALGKLGHLTFIDAQRSSVLDNKGNAMPALNQAQKDLPKEFQYTSAGEEALLLGQVETAVKAAIYHRGKHPGELRQASPSAIQKDISAMQNQLTSYSTYIGAASENLASEAKKINKLQQTQRGRQANEPQQDATVGSARGY